MNFFVWWSISGNISVRRHRRLINNNRSKFVQHLMMTLQSQFRSIRLLIYICVSLLPSTFSNSGIVMQRTAFYLVSVKRFTSTSTNRNVVVGFSDDKVLWSCCLPSLYITYHFPCCLIAVAWWWRQAIPHEHWRTNPPSQGSSIQNMISITTLFLLLAFQEYLCVCVCVCVCAPASARDKRVWSPMNFTNLPRMFLRNMSSNGEQFWKICVLNWRSFLRNMYV
jgi:hypothetical protein